jgi:type II secretion system protein N
VAYTSIFLGAFVLWFALKIPDAVVMQSVLTTLNQNSPYRWQADRSSFHWFLSPHIRFEKLSLLPNHGGAPIELALLKISPGLLSLIPWTGKMNPSISFSLEGYGGEASGKIKPLGIGLVLDSENLKLDTLATNFGIDLRGTAKEIAADVNLPSQKLAQLNGELQIKGEAIGFDPASLGLPLPLPLLDLGPVLLEAKAEGGKVTIQNSTIGSPSKDLEAKIKGSIQLMDPWFRSSVDIRVALKISEKMKKAMPDLETMLGAFGDKKPDGTIGMIFQGNLANPILPKPDKQAF